MDALIGQCSTVPPELLDGSAYWTGEHTKEAELQRRKRLHRALDCVQEGGMLEHEVVAQFGSTAAAAAAAEQRHKKRRHNLRAYVSRKKRCRWLAPAARTPAQLLSGKRVLVDAKVVHVAPAVDLDQRLADLGAVPEANMQCADAFLVADVASPGQRISWNAMLGGGVLLSVPFFLGGCGPVVQWVRALDIWRRVWISGAFREAHPQLTSILIARMASPGSRWRGLRSLEEYMTAALKAHQAKRSPSENIAFVTQQEVAEVSDVSGGGVAFNLKLLTSESALAFLAKVRRGGSTIAVCRR